MLNEPPESTHGIPLGSLKICLTQWMEQIVCKEEQRERNDEPV